MCGKVIEKDKDTIDVEDDETMLIQPSFRRFIRIRHCKRMEDSGVIEAPAAIKFLLHNVARRVPLLHKPLGSSIDSLCSFA
jgi:hypothetical protein